MLNYVYSPVPTMSKDTEIPSLHLVPAAIDNITLQAPFTQRWNPVPSMQFHNASGVHFVPGAKELIGINGYGESAVAVDPHVEREGVGSSDNPLRSAVGNSLDPVESSIEGLPEPVEGSTGPGKSVVGGFASELNILVGDGRGTSSAALIDAKAQEPSGGAVSEFW